MTEAEYVTKAWLDDDILPQDVANLTRFFQARYIQPDGDQPLAADGKPGPATLAALRKLYAPRRADGPFLACPLPYLPGRGTPQARKPQVTSGFRQKDRPDHDGLDIFYRWEPGDQPAFVGDGGCEGKNSDGTPRWVVPYGTVAQAAADGVVQIAGPSPTGYRVWVNHGNGLRSGYFHLSTLTCQPGLAVKKGTALGLVGHNPSGGADGRHLHFEVSPVERYEPLDPTKYLLPW